MALVLSSLVSFLASAQMKVSPAFAGVGGEFLLGSASLSWTSVPAATPEPGGVGKEQSVAAGGKQELEPATHRKV